MEAALRHHGILHLLFHPAHIAKPGVADAILTAVRATRAVGMAWWTAAQINAWERARRQANWSDYQAANGATSVTLTSEADLPGATILWLGDEAVTLEANGNAVDTTLVTRWGFPFHAATLDVRAQEATVLGIGELAGTLRIRF
jgi:hypothetical protein